MDDRIPLGARGAFPFHFMRDPKTGVVLIDGAADQEFRKLLLAGVPRPLRSKMVEALAAIPDRNSFAHSVRYFGAERVKEITAAVTPLIDQLHLYFSNAFNRPGLDEWLVATGFANDYRMIKVFYAWATEYKLDKPKIIDTEPASAAVN